jgi:hypothetical protein
MDRRHGLSPAGGAEIEGVVIGVVQDGEAGLLKSAAKLGGSRNAKQFGCGLLAAPHLLVAEVVSVPSRLPKTICAPRPRIDSTGWMYVAGSGGISGALPSMVSPTAVMVTEAAAFAARGLAGAPAAAGDRAESSVSHVDQLSPGTGWPAGSRGKMARSRVRTDLSSPGRLSCPFVAGGHCDAPGKCRS